MTAIGEFDCANPACDRYQVLVERRWVENHRARCVICGRALRLIQLHRPMSDAARARVAAAAARRKEVA